MLTTHAEIESFARRPDGTVERVPRPDALDAVEELREVMYRSGAGLWLSSRWTVTNDDEPEWSRPVDPVVYRLDLEDLPRRDDLVPA